MDSASIQQQVIANHGLRVIPGADIEGKISSPIPVPDRLNSLGTLAGGLVNMVISDKLHALAAPQVGVFASMFCCRFQGVDDRVAVVFSPEYYPSGKSHKKRALMSRSVSYRIQAWRVPRYKTIHARYENMDGGVIEVKLKGKDAIMFQEMTDLLSGVTIKTAAQVLPEKRKK